MPKQRDLKRLIRTRMAKTGESHSAARRMIVGPDEPERGPMGDEQFYVMEWDGALYARGQRAELGAAHGPGVYRGLVVDGGRYVPGAEFRVVDDAMPAHGSGPRWSVQFPATRGGELVVDEPGLVIVPGGTATGMTALSTLMAAAVGDRATLTRINCPEGGFGHLPSDYSRVFDAVINSSKDIHFIDRLTYFALFVGDSYPALPGGVSQGFFQVAYAFGWHARRAGKLVFATVNPLVSGDDLQQFVERCVNTPAVSVLQTEGCTVAEGRASVEVRAWIRSAGERTWDRRFRLEFEDATPLTTRQHWLTDIPGLTGATSRSTGAVGGPSPQLPADGWHVIRFSPDDVRAGRSIQAQDQFQQAFMQLGGLPDVSLWEKSNGLGSDLYLSPTTQPALVDWLSRWEAEACAKPGAGEPPFGGPNLLVGTDEAWDLFD